MMLNKDKRLTPNFTRQEMIDSDTAERLGIDNTPSFEIMQNILITATWLQKLRDRLSKKYERDVVIIVKSGYRCPELNKAIGGAKRSAHLKGLAADIVAVGLTPYQLTCDIIDLMETWDQVVLEFDRWVHVGLCNDFELNREQMLEAIKQEKSFGKTVTKYIQFSRRTPEYAFG